MFIRLEKRNYTWTMEFNSLYAREWICLFGDLLGGRDESECLWKPASGKSVSKN
jgi:hypothetical protein